MEVDVFVVVGGWVTYIPETNFHLAMGGAGSVPGATLLPPLVKTRRFKLVVAPNVKTPTG